MTEAVETVRSEQTGIVLTIRTFSRVLTDEALAVVLETHLESRTTTRA